MYTCSGYTPSQRKDTADIDSTYIYEQEIVLDENGVPLSQPTQEAPSGGSEEDVEIILDPENM